MSEDKAKLFVNIDMCELTVRLFEAINEVERSNPDAVKSLQALPLNVQTDYCAGATAAVDFLMQSFTEQGIPIGTDKSQMN